MSVRDELLSQLLHTPGVCVSGAELAKSLSVSRNAVWKAVQLLIEEGYPVTTVAGKGYRLSEDSDIVSALSIQPFLKNPDRHPLIVQAQVTSTNDVAKGIAAQGAAEGTVVIAREQTAGRGRRGRSFYSPEQDGIYMTLVLRPKMPAQEALCLTTIAAVAVTRAIHNVVGREAKIKWVNDVLIDGKKVCGILTEASLSMEGGTLDYAVVGIGLNMHPPGGGYPEDIRHIAGCIAQDPTLDQVSSRMVAAVITEFFAFYDDIESARYMDEYRARSAVVGRAIDVWAQDKTRRAKALFIDDECALHVQYEDGTKQALSSGEVSIRL